MKDKQILDKPITLGWLIQFALPTIISTVFLNIYSTVDGIFVSRLIDTDALSAVNIVMPMVTIVSAVGMMFGSGGNALVAKKLGEGKAEEAREDFSLLIVIAFLVSVILAALSYIFLHPILQFLGADDTLMTYCVEYMIPVLIIIPFTIFSTVFQMFFITVGKAKFGLILSVIGGVLNIFFDWFFIAVLNMGIAGAAIATGIGYAMQSVFGLLWFWRNKHQSLYLVRPKWRIQTLTKSCTNGASEMVSVLSYSIVSILFNNILMRLAGSNGVASITIILYAQGLFSSIFRGYGMGISPIVSYNYGRGEHQKQRKTFAISIKFIASMSVIAAAVCFVCGSMVVGIFAGTNEAVQTMALHGFHVVAVSFLILGINIFASIWFTALNDGIASAVLSFCRACVFLVVPMLILSTIFGLEGVWWALPVGELLSLMVAVYYYRKWWKKRNSRTENNQKGK